MTRKLYLGTDLQEMPLPFLNLYRSLGRVSVYKFDCVNEFLDKEPYSACLKEAYITSSRVTDWWLEFDSEQDYLAFLMKWS